MTFLENHKKKFDEAYKKFLPDMLQIIDVVILAITLSCVVLFIVYQIVFHRIF